MPGMTDNNMHVPHASKSSSRHTASLSTKAGEMASGLSYSNMLMNQNGTLLRQDEIQEMREKQGFCPTCKGTPVKLFEVRKTKLNPLWKSKEPLSVPNESYKGLCLKCHPETDVHRASMTSTKTQETSSRSAFVGGQLTVTKFDDSQGLTGSLLEQTEASFHTAGISDSMISNLTQEESFSTAQQDFSSSLVGTNNPIDMNDSSGLRRNSPLTSKPLSPDPTAAAAFNRRRKSPPLVLSGIPTDARHDSRNDALDVSRRNSVPISSGPELANGGNVAKVPPPKAPPPDPEQQEILNALNNSRRGANRGSATKPSYQSAPKKPPPGEGTATIAPKKRPTGRQAAETMDRLRAAYERTFHGTGGMSDDISAITIDIDQQNSSGMGERNNSGGISLDSDSLLEEFSVPDFSMGTGDAIKSHRSPKPARVPRNRAQAPSASTNQRFRAAPSTSTNQKLRAAGVVEPKQRRMTEVPRKPYRSVSKATPVPKNMTEVARKPYKPSKPTQAFASDDARKPEAKPIHQKPEAKPPAAAGMPKNDFATTRKYDMMDSGVSAIPGPPEKLESMTRMEQKEQDVDPSIPPDKSLSVSVKYGYPEGIARVPSSEEGSSLAPPSLVDSSGTVEDLTVESKTEGDIVSVDSKVEEISALINDVVAAENPEFLAELLSNTMRTQRERVDIQALCLATIWDMSKYNFENKSVIMASGLYECVISAMKDFPNSVEVQSSGCGALWSLSVNQFNRVILVRAGACERILRGLDTHLNNVEFVETALGALRTLSPEPEARMVINHMLGNQRVVRVMGLHRFVVDIQRDGCAFLSNVAVDIDNQEVSVVSREELQAVVRAMRDHLKNESVVTSACFTLKNFSYEERNVRNLRMFDDVVMLLEDAAQYATKASCRRDAAEVLKQMQLQQTEDTALEETAFSSLMQAMRRTSTEKNPAKQVEESVATITEVIKEYYWSTRLICFGFESLLSLADKSEAHLSRILSPKTLRVIINTMKEHAFNPKVQQRGCELLRALAEPNKPVNRMEICMEEGCSVIVAALRNHRGDETVDIPAYAALQSLVQEPMCAEEIQRCGGWQIIREHENEVPSATGGSDEQLGDGLDAVGVAVASTEQPYFAKLPPEP